jgi:hypothetical protein
MPVADSELLHNELAVNGDGPLLYNIWSIVVKVKSTDLHHLRISRRPNSVLYLASSSFGWSDGE